MIILLHPASSRIVVSIVADGFLLTVILKKSPHYVLMVEVLDFYFSY